MNNLHTNREVFKTMKAPETLEDVKKERDELLRTIEFALSGAQNKVINQFGYIRLRLTYYEIAKNGLYED